jgi:hypothetical protein
MVLKRDQKRIKPKCVKKLFSEKIGVKIRLPLFHRIHYQNSIKEISMRQKIYGTFSNVDDAKQAFGNIKKVSLNQADLTIVFADNREARSYERQAHFEFGTENHGELPQGELHLGDLPQYNNCIWPGLQSKNLSGIGKIQMGTSNHHGVFNFIEPRICISGEDLGVIAPQIKANKVVAIIEADAVLVPQLRFILESNGAEVHSNPE